MCVRDLCRVPSATHAKDDEGRLQNCSGGVGGRVGDLQIKEDEERVQGEKLESNWHNRTF